MLEPVPAESHPSEIELEDLWFARQPQPPLAPQVDRAAADLLEIDGHVGSCAPCRARMAALDTQRSAFLDLHPFPAELLTPPARPAPSRHPSRWLGLAAVLLLGVLLGRGLFVPERAPEPEQGLRMKGGETRLALLRSTATGWAPVEQPRPGEELRLSLLLPEAGYPLVVLEQEDGARFLAYPPPGAPQPEVPAHREVRLAGSVRLDAYSGRQRLLLWTLPNPPSEDQLADLGRSLRPPDEVLPLVRGD